MITKATNIYTTRFKHTCKTVYFTHFNNTLNQTLLDKTLHAHAHTE